MTGTKPAVQRVHPPDWLMRLVNPILRRLIARGRTGEQLIVLHYRGRKSGRLYDVPAGYLEIDGVPSVLTNSRWRHYFKGGRDLDVTIRGPRRQAKGHLVDDPDEVAAVYERLSRQMGLKAAKASAGYSRQRPAGTDTGRDPRHDQARTDVGLPP